MTTIDAHRIQLNYPLQQGVCSSGDIRALIADQLGVNVERVTDQSHFVRDLGVDRLTRLELVILVEDWTGLELRMTMSNRSQLSAISSAFCECGRRESAARTSRRRALDRGTSRIAD
jgi:acyl carrier protein